MSLQLKSQEIIPQEHFSGFCSAIQIPSVFVSQETPEKIQKRIAKRIQPLGYKLGIWSFDERDDMPDRDEYDSYEEYNRDCCYIYYMTRVQRQIETLVDTLSDKDLVECLTPLKNESTENEMNHLLELYLL